MKNPENRTPNLWRKDPRKNRYFLNITGIRAEISTNDIISDFWLLTCPVLHIHDEKICYESEPIDVVFELAENMLCELLEPKIRIYTHALDKIRRT